MSENDQASAATTNNAPEQEFGLQRIYTKDVSFETPNSPDVFTQDWKPEINMNLQTSSRSIGSDVYEVVLHITLTCKMGEKTAYLCEVQQAGIFGVRGFDEAEMGHMMGAYCPNVLFPYVREVISDLVTKGSFPQMVVSPVNFDALYQQQLQQQASQKEGQPSTH